jgi:hypothetical protein
MRYTRSEAREMPKLIGRHSASRTSDVKKRSRGKMAEEMQKIVYVMFLLAALMCCVSAESWSGYVGANNGFWQISRHSTNITADISGSVEGSISPVDYRGRVLSPYAYYSKDAVANDVEIRERTAARQGMYKSVDLFKMESNLSSAPGYKIDKPAGSSIWTTEFYADWPLLMSSGRIIDYIGRNINDREYISNGGDSVDTAFLYNMKLTKERDLNLSTRNLNATIFATNDSILSASLDEEKEIDYGLNSHSTGIADLKFKQSGPYYIVGSRDYEVLSEGEERYIGDYSLNRKIKMISNHTRERLEDEWLPCCYEGWADLNPKDKTGHSAESIFDCTCFEAKGI